MTRRPSTLGPTSRSLVGAARAGLDPSADAKARVRARVAMAVSGATVASPQAVSSAVVKTSVVGKLAVVGVAAALVVGGFVATRDRTPVVAPSIEVGDRDREIPNVVATTSVAHDDVAPRIEKATRAEPRLRTPPAAATEPMLVPASETEPMTLAREVALIDQAMASLRSNDPDAALATLVTYEHESAGHGQLEEDAAALVIDAKCHEHQPVSDLLREFDRRYPSSAQRSHLAETCK